MTTPDHQDLPPVATAPEVARYLRLIDDTTSIDGIAKARRVVDRLRLEGRLRGVRPSKEYIYTRAEIEGFLTREVDAQRLSVPAVSQHFGFGCAAGEAEATS